MNRTILSLSLALLALGAACNRSKSPAATTTQPAGGVEDASTQPLPGPVKQGLWILQPADGAGAPYRPVVVGTISDTTALPIFLVVRASGMPDYWVQSAASVRRDGMWLCQPYVGLADTKAGIAFELRAVAAPKNPLQSGQPLKAWPEGRYQSQVVTVTRQ